MKTLIAILLFSSILSFSQKKDSLRIELLKSDYFKEFIKQQELIKQKEQETLDRLLQNELPNFSLPLLNGGNLWSETLKGKPTVINFWHSNCQPCIDETVTLNELKKQYGEHVNFIAITNQDEKEVRSFLEDVPFHYTHIINANAYTQQLHFWRYPKTFVLDANLTVYYIGKPEESKTLEEDISSQNKFKKEISTQLEALLNFY